MLMARAGSRDQSPLILIAMAALGLVLSACATAPMHQAGVGKSSSAHTQAQRGKGKNGRKPTPQRRAEAPRPTVRNYTPPADQPMAPPRGRLLALADLRGWAEEDHAAALAAFQAGCGASRDPSLRALCARARNLGAADDETARRFLEHNFRVESNDAEGVLTAYFAPEYEARTQPDAEFSMPVRAKPGRAPVVIAAAAPRPAPAPSAAAALDALVNDAVAQGYPGPSPEPLDPIDAALSQAELEAKAYGLKSGPPPPSQPPSQAIVGYTSIDLANADRRQIETAPPNGALAWMRAEDLFFLQIQGSGTLRFPDGRRMKAAYAGDNGKPFVAIARPMVEAGQLQQNKASGDGIRGWLAAHRGPEALAVMWKNPRYVFFSLSPDDGKEPAGAAGVPLPAGRALAVDPGRHPYGEVWWIDAEAPVLAGANAKYRRLAMALDTGAAIRGEIRADLYIGRGDRAGLEAGRVRHTLKMMRLVPVEAAARNDGRDELDYARR
jgi:membrane-bound lytic murein transglycosylase A